MSDNKPENDADDLDWLEIEDEDFDEHESEGYKDSQNAASQNELKSSQKNKAEKSKKKSSSSSMVLIILLVAFGAGGYLYLTATPKHNRREDKPTDRTPVVSVTPEVLSTPGQPVAPATPTDIASAPTTAPDNATPISQVPANPANTVTAPAIPPVSADVLTPMPSSETLDQTQLVPLDAEQNKEKDVLPTTTAQEATDAVIPPQNTKIAIAVPPTPVTPENLNNIALIDSTQPETNKTAVIPANSASINEKELLAQTDKPPAAIPETASLPLMPSDTDTAAILPVTTTEQEHTIPEPQQPVSAPAPAKTVTATDKTPVLKPPVPAVEAPKVSNAPGSPALNKNDLQPKVVDIKPEVATIQAPVPTMPQDVEFAKNAKTAETQSQKAEPTAEPVRETKPKVEKPAPKAKSQEKPVRMPSWQLRAAQSGSATLFDPGTGNIQTVEAGDNVKGIGKVKSITLVNGKWLVRGTSGVISQ